MLRLSRSCCLLISVLIVTVILSSTFVEIQAAMPTTVTGTIFIDNNLNGSKDGLEPGVSGIIVSAFDATGQIATTTTDINGSYTLITTTTNVIRVEVEETSLGTRKAMSHGPNNPTTTFFIPANSGIVTRNIPLDDPANLNGFCQYDPVNLTGQPRVVTTCFQYAGSSANLPAVVDFPNTATGTGQDTILANTAGTAGVGAVLGAAYERQTKNILVATYLKRHAAFGSNGPGAIYRIDRSIGLPNTAVFYTLNAGTDDHVPSDWLHDPTVYGEVGKVSLGGMVIDDTNDVLYVINLFDRNLYKIPIKIIGGIPFPNTANVLSIPTPNIITGCPNTPTDTTNASDVRPFGLGFYQGQLYLGEVCSAETTQSQSDLRAYVYQFDPTTNQFKMPAVLEFALNYPRGCANAAGDISGCNPPPPGGTGPVPYGSGFTAAWRPWTSTWTVPPTLTSIPAGRLNTGGTGVYDVTYPQPMLTQLTFDRGNMIIGFRDRFGDQSGNNTSSPTPTDRNLYGGITAGDVLRACLTGTIWTLEINATCGGKTTGGVNDNRGPGGGEYYIGQRFISNSFAPHDKVALGGVVQIPGSMSVIATMFDARNLFYTAGIRGLNNTTGADVQEYDVYVRDFSTPRANFGKASGLGTLAIECGLVPLEIGNYVWLDKNADGVQGPDEPPIANVVINLYDLTDPQNPLFVGTTTTDNNGEYYFGGTIGPTAGTLKPFTQYAVVIAPSNFNTSGPLQGLTTTQTGAGNVQRDSNGVNQNNPALGGSVVLANVTTGNFGANDHTIDFGFHASLLTVTPGMTSNAPPSAGTVDLQISKIVDLALARPGDSVTFTITVTNRGALNATSVVVTDTLPELLTFVSAKSSQGSYSVKGQILTFTLNTITPGQVITITVVTQVRPDAKPPIDITNTATLLSNETAMRSATISLRITQGLLPVTGEHPASPNPLLTILMVVVLTLAFVAVFILRLATRR